MVKKTFKCHACNKIFTREVWKDAKDKSKNWCSFPCHVVSKTFWKNSSWKDKVGRLQKYFDKYVIKQEGCWGWRGTLLDGRGRLYFEKRAIQAHRASWMIYKGKIPLNKYVCHNCPGGDNKICTNPDHLFLGSPQENIRDVFNKGGRSNSKLDINKVKEIKKMLREGIPSYKIAFLFNVTRSTICDIKKKRIWSYITE